MVAINKKTHNTLKFLYNLPKYFILLLKTLNSQNYYKYYGKDE